MKACIGFSLIFASSAILAAALTAGCKGSPPRTEPPAATSATTPASIAPAAPGFDPRLYRAAEGGHRHIIEDRFKHGADLNAPNPADGRTALHAAAFNGHKKLIAYLLTCGANPNAQDKDGNTPLHLAAMMGHGDSTAALVGATNLSLRNKAGKTPREAANPKVLVYFPAS